VAVRGPITQIDVGEIGRAHINFLSNRYFGRPINQSDDPNEIRARYTITPQHISAMG
jgi:hypothetical protein